MKAKLSLSSVQKANISSSRWPLFCHYQHREIFLPMFKSEDEQFAEGLPSPLPTNRKRINTFPPRAGTDRFTYNTELLLACFLLNNRIRLKCALYKTATLAPKLDL